MPSAISTKHAMNGTKRKDAPGKDAYVKHSKKPKTESGLKSALKKDKPKQKAAPVKKIQELSDSEDSDSDGGVLLNSASGEDSEGPADAEDSEEAQKVAE